ncbi:MAG: methyltransferase domain-containing protein [Marinobacter sp.]|uniref:class I SAM-dependent methyltransferase n=1 Tax=Marinobacter sp. TaxID=50741 RepID=UPI001B456925|nr:class I SAM-dependent methyltransferase [Marinobacter sp.]MBQ0746784.1 methyltransferase domain-containing protein [Marinobacter sp.]MBQ0813454.1 methyltransferase domain-containing protein [Marinobacter sp.]
MKKSKIVDYPSRHESFEDWFQTPLGRSMLADQRRFLDQKLARLTGARQLQVSVSHRIPLANGTDFSQKVMTTPKWFTSIPDGVVVCDADELPFPGDSMDLVVLHHTADFSPYPHQALREAARVLRGEGMIAVVGFNPVSVWGLRRLISRHHAGPWGGRFLMRGRMEDWLHLLGFQVDVSVTRFFRLPLQRSGRKASGRFGERLTVSGLLPVGAYYCILAKKRVSACIPRRAAWRQNNVMGIPGTGTVSASRGCPPQSLNHPED